MTAGPGRSIGEWVDFGLLFAAKGLLAAGLVIRLSGGIATADRVLAAGILTLMATPAVRLINTMIEDVRRGDWLTLAATSGVGAVLLWSVFTALR
jgi:hypothetical protein